MGARLTHIWVIRGALGGTRGPRHAASGVVTAALPPPLFGSAHPVTSAAQALQLSQVSQAGASNGQALRIPHLQGYSVD